MNSPEQRSPREAPPVEGLVSEKTDEYRDKQSKRLVAFLDRINAEEVLADDESRKEFIKNLDFDGFKDLLIRVNGIVRDIPIKKRKFDGTTVLLTSKWAPGYVPPSYEDKEPLLRETFDKAKGMGDMKDTALIVSALINAIHPFADGNGRTSRLIYQLISEGYHGSEEEKGKLSKILGDTGRFGFDVNPTIIEEEVLDIVKKEELGLDSANPNDPMGMWETTGTREIKFKENISKKEELAFMDMISLRGNADSFGYGFVATYKYLKDAGRLNEKYFKTFHDQDGKPIRTRMLTEVVSQDLDSKDIQGIIKVLREIKRAYIKKLIDVLSDPQKYPSGEASGGNLKDYFEGRIKW